MKKSLIGIGTNQPKALQIGKPTLNSDRNAFHFQNIQSNFNAKYFLATKNTNFSERIITNYVLISRWNKQTISILQTQFRYKLKALQQIAINSSILRPAFVFLINTKKTYKYFSSLDSIGLSCQSASYIQKDQKKKVSSFKNISHFKINVVNSLKSFLRMLVSHFASGKYGNCETRKKRQQNI